MNFKFSTALAAVMALGQKAIAVAQEADKPGVQALHDDAIGAVKQLETDAVDVGEATIEGFVVSTLTPTIGADAAKAFASTYARAGEQAIAAKIGVTAQ